MRHVRREGVQVVEDSEAESGEEEEEARDGEGDEEGEEEERGGELKGFEGNRDEECKLVLVVRTDLGMGKGVCRL